MALQELFGANEDLTSLKDKVVVATGAASGIGLATVEVLLSIGAKVAAGDINDSPLPNNDNFISRKTDVTSWTDLCDLFDTAKEKFGHVDHAFVNAGINGTANLLVDEHDEQGKLKQPNHAALNINFIGALDTMKLGIHHIRSNPDGGSIVLMSSASGFQRVMLADYAASKHGVLGLLRGYTDLLGPRSGINVRLNAITPAWTASGLAPVMSFNTFKEAGIVGQTAEQAGRAALLCMANSTLHGKIVYAVQGKYTEVESAFDTAATDIIKRTARVEPHTRDERDEFLAMIMAIRKMRPN